MKLIIDSLSKQFSDNKFPAVDHITFSVVDQEILAFVGPSGCGKTTTLRMIAGLERPEEGTITLNNKIINSDKVFVPPELRNIGMVFQDHALFPHLSVSANIAFGLKGKSKKEIHDRVQTLLEMIAITSLAKRYPHQLSGGERQRVALARALAPYPELLLMDEPFSSLDAHLRLEVREQVRNILKASNTTAIFVTHDQEEALFMGDRMAVFNHGQIEQIGEPENVFHNSGTRFVAQFMGDSDFLHGITTTDGVHTQMGFLSQKHTWNVNLPVEIAVRADDINFAPSKNGNGTILNRFFRGAFNFYRVQLDTGEILHVYKLHTEIHQPGERIEIYFDAGHPLKIFPEGKRENHSV